MALWKKETKEKSVKKAVKKTPKAEEKKPTTEKKVLTAEGFKRRLLKASN